MLYLVDRLTRDVGCYFSVLGIYFAHTTERKILRMKFNEKLIEIRKKQGLSQEELGMELQVSRQTISKWETGESLPDIERCKLLAEVLDVSLDDLVNYDKENSNNLGLGVPPKGKHVFGITKVGEKGQIVIPGQKPMKNI